LLALDHADCLQISSLIDQHQTDAMKLKRAEINAFYKAQLTALYKQGKK
jgi:hypothetical protein